MTAFYMRRPALAAAVLLAAIAAWLSQATLAVAAPDGPRIALVPVSAAALLIVVIAGASPIAVHRAGLSIAPFWLLAFIVLPWLPLPVPSAFLVWSGAIRRLIWVAVAVLVAAQAMPRARSLLRSTSIASLFSASPRLAAGVLAFVLFSWSAWEVSPSVPGGDEPHYLVIAQSLLLDGDLKIENNHRRGDYQSYNAGPLPPHYIQRGRNGEIYSIHAPGLAAVVAPAFFVGGYRGVVLFLLVLAACGGALAWHLAWLATRNAPAAWFGWAAVTVSATTIFHSFTVYPDGLGGLVALTGVWALFRAAAERTSGGTRLTPWLLHGAALALLPWLHSRFAVLAGTLGALVLLRLPLTKSPAAKAAAFLSIPAVSAMCWVGYFIAIYGRPDPSAPYGTSRDFSLAFIPGGLAGLLFDQRFGLIANAPVLIFGFVGLVMMMRQRSSSDVGAEAGVADRRLALELLFVLVPYLLTATSYAMWWAGWSAPARFANPAVLALAIPCAVAWLRLRDRAARTIAALSLALSAWLSFVLVSTDGGRLAYNTRETTALWLDWASRLVPLGEGMPVWYRGREAVFTRDVALWSAGMLAAYAVARALASSSILRDRTRYATAVAAMFMSSAMIALSIVWVLRGIDGASAAPAQLDFLRRVAVEPRAVALQLLPPRVLDRQQVPGMIRIESENRLASGGLGRNEQPLATFPSVPAGTYRVFLRTRGPGGWVIVGVGQDQFALRSTPLSFPPSAIDIDVPIDVRALVVRADEEARRTVRTVVLEPVAIANRSSTVTDRVARRAVRYDGATVFFLDEGAFPEPEAFWVGGARDASFVVQPASPASSIPVLLRNAPVENLVTLTSGQWKEALTMAPGEERQIEIPIAPGRTAALVTAASRSGFRPSETQPQSRDNRFLGVWLKVGGRDR
jgi:hypothetical protein